MEFKITECNEIMKTACELSELSITRGGGPFGCVIYKEGEGIIGRGHNMVTINNDPTQHAEIVAIRDACRFLNTFELSDCTLYTSCEPCPMCLSAIYWARLNHVYYGNTKEQARDIGFDDEFIYKEFEKPVEERKIKMERLDQDIAIKAFIKWNEKTDKIEY
jgi:tRNA(Arg) A34 adenosine deaminase TadA